MLRFHNTKSCWTMTRLIVRVFQCQLFSPGVTVEDLETGKNTRRLQSYCVSCYGRVQYDYGLLGIRMLALKTSDEAVFFDYYKSSKEVGWKKAFENVFGLTVTQFYHELEILLRKSEKEQIRALKRE